MSIESFVSDAVDKNQPHNSQYLTSQHKQFETKPQQMTITLYIKQPTKLLVGKEQQLNEASLEQLNQKLLSLLSQLSPNKLAQGVLKLANAEKEDWQRFANTIVRFSHGQEIPDDDKTHAMSFLLHTAAMVAAPGWTSWSNFALNRLLSTATWRFLRSKLFGIDKAQLELTDDLSSLLRNVETMLAKLLESSNSSDDS